MLYSLPEYDRLFLANQFRILARLYPEDAAKYLERANVLIRGYQEFYEDVFQDLEPELEIEDSNYVIAVLEMYSALQHSYATFSDKSEIEWNDLLFPGFDGNTRPEFLGFARCLRERGRFADVQLLMPDMNSHHSFAAEYQRMMEAWKGYRSPDELTARQVKYIIAAQKGRGLNEGIDSLTD